MNAAKWWCATSYSMDKWDGERTFPTGMRYAVWQHEQCPETGKIHSQILLCLEVKKRMKQLKEYLSEPQIHLEQARDIEASKIYVQKASTRIAGPFTYGKDPSETKENILAALKKRGLHSMVEENPTRVKLLKDLMEFCIPNRQEMTTGLYLHGPAGKGKTKIAHLIGQFAGGSYFKDPSKWWNGYQGEPIVIIDDYRQGFSEDYILRLCDRYPLRVETKGGYINFNSPMVIFTSNEDSRTTIGCSDQIKRRIKTLTLY